MWFIAIVVVAALLLGILANRLFRDRVTGDEGPTARDLLSPLLTLAVLFIAFVLALSSQSYSAARDAAADEGAIVDNLYEATEYLDSARLRVGMQAALVCYARAVEGPEWEALARGEGSSPVASNWTGTGPHGLRLKFQRLGPENPVFGTFVALDRDRGDTRRARVAASKGTVPTVVFGFMLALVGLALALLAFFLPRKKRGPQFTTLALVALVLVAALALIYSLDHPFSGALKIAPTAMRDTAADITEDYVEDLGAGRLPCDRRGNPLNAKRLRLGTSAGS